MEPVVWETAARYDRNSEAYLIGVRITNNRWGSYLLPHLTLLKMFYDYMLLFDFSALQREYIRNHYHPGPSGIPSPEFGAPGSSILP